MQITVAQPLRSRHPLRLPVPLTAGYPWLLAGLTALAFSLRLGLLDRFPLREDEALYSYWALHGWRVDPLFLQVWPDKPPLFLWLLSAVFQLFGVSQASARLANVLISTLTIPVVAATASHLWGRRSAAVAAFTVALNPFAISFAATAYTDPLLVLAGSLAVLAALRRLPFWVGLWLGVAIMTKQQGLLYAPLVLALVVWPASTRPDTIACMRSILLRALRFIGGAALIMLPILYWDSLRWAVAPSPWDLSIRNYSALAWAPAQDWLPRLKQWLALAWYLLASWPVWIVLGALAMLAASRQLARALHPPDERIDMQPTITPAPQHPSTLIPRLCMMLWGLAFLTLHIATTVQVWDRYLLPLAPLLALASGHWIAGLSRTVHTRWLVGILLAWLVCLTPPALAAAEGRLPVGGDHGAYTGLNAALDWLKSNYPKPIILYHHDLGWHYRFYLYDEVTRGQYDLRWFPYAVYLADNAVKAPQRPKVLIQPAWASTRALALHLQVRGLELRRRARFGQFTLYEIEQPEQPYCTWCACRPAARFGPFTEWRTP